MIEHSHLLYLITHLLKNFRLVWRLWSESTSERRFGWFKAWSGPCFPPGRRDWRSRPQIIDTYQDIEKGEEVEHPLTEVLGQQRSDHWDHNHKHPVYSSPEIHARRAKDLRHVGPEKRTRWELERSYEEQDQHLLGSLHCVGVENGSEKLEQSHREEADDHDELATQLLHEHES